MIGQICKWIYHRAGIKKNSQHHLQACIPYLTVYNTHLIYPENVYKNPMCIIYRNTKIGTEITKIIGRENSWHSRSPVKMRNRMIAIRYSWFFIPISPIPEFWQLKTSNSIWFVVIWYPFHVHAFFVYAFLFCWSCDLFKGKLLKQAYAYESVLITGLWQDSTVTWINQPAQLIYCSSK